MNADKLIEELEKLDEPVEQELFMEENEDTLCTRKTSSINSSNSSSSLRRFSRKMSFVTGNKLHRTFSMRSTSDTITDNYLTRRYSTTMSLLRASPHPPPPPPIPLLFSNTQPECWNPLFRTQSASSSCL